MVPLILQELNLCPRPHLTLNPFCHKKFYFMKSMLLHIYFGFVGFTSIAQGQISGKIAQESKIHIAGTVMDSATGKGIAGATIELTYDYIDATTVNSTASKRIAVANTEGRFVIENIPFVKECSLTISAVGYKTISREIFLANPVDGKAIVKNIGTIKLLRQPKMLANVIVTAVATPPMQFGIDRKIFNVEKNITAQGGTAVDVMKNIPSLSVDVDGNVQMRNSLTQIFIDGRPTILTLDQIPADDIERVELITNPSAKYDASSAGGIINIVMKKNKRVGLNGIASIGCGAPGFLNGNVNLNLRAKKIQFFCKRQLQSFRW